MSDSVSIPALPFTPFEEYMLADDRARWPMTFFVQVTLRGRLDRAVWEQAIGGAVAHHPLLHRLLSGNETTGYYWSTTAARLPPIRWGALDQPLDFPDGRMIDLRRQGGFRVWVRERDDRTNVWFEFHHSCCDGVGGVRFIADCLAAYAAPIEALGPGPRRTVRPERLVGRGRFGMTWWRQVLRLPQELLALIGAFEFFSHRPVSLVTSDEQARVPERSEGPLWLSHQFNARKLTQLRDTARAHGATLNDWLVACLFAALRDWFVAHAPEAEGKVARVMVPMNLRLPVDEETPAANIVCMINLDRRMKEKATVPRLLKLVSLEMAVVKRCRLGLAFHHILGIARRLRCLPRMLPTDRCLSTCVLSNLGEPLADEHSLLSRTALGSVHGAGLTLESLALLPPLRPYTAAALGVVSHRDTTTITLHYDPSLGLEKANALMQAFVRQIDTTCGGA